MAEYMKLDTEGLKKAVEGLLSVLSLVRVTCDACLEGFENGDEVLAKEALAAMRDNITRASMEVMKSASEPASEEEYAKARIEG